MGLLPDRHIIGLDPDRYPHHALENLLTHAQLLQLYLVTTINGLAGDCDLNAFFGEGVGGCRILSEES